MIDPRLVQEGPPERQAVLIYTPRSPSAPLAVARTSSSNARDPRCARPRGVPLGFPWVSLGFPLGFPWVSLGFPLGFPLTLRAGRALRPAAGAQRRARPREHGRGAPPPRRAPVRLTAPPGRRRARAAARVRPRTPPRRGRRLLGRHGVTCRRCCRAPRDARARATSRARRRHRATRRRCERRVSASATGAALPPGAARLQHGFPPRVRPPPPRMTPNVLTAPARKAPKQKPTPVDISTPDLPQA